MTVTAAICAAFARRPWLALLLAIVSCSFEESVFVALAGISLAIAAVEFQRRRACAADVSPALAQDASPQRKRGRAAPSLALRASERDARITTSPTGLPAWVWLSAALCFALGFVVVVRVVGLSEGTLRWRFGNLGESLAAAALSPVLRPKTFWGQIFRPESLYFVLALMVPAGAIFVVRGWRALLGLAAPLLVLLTWSVDGSTCIALQYVTLLIPCIVLAALLGAESIASQAGTPLSVPGGTSPSAPGGTSPRVPGGTSLSAAKGVASPAATPLVPQGAPTKTSRPVSARLLMAWAGLSALAGGAVASIFFGALPVSRPTIPFTLAAKDRAALRPRFEILDHAVETASKPDASVLASCRLAAHLLNVRRLEDVNFGLRKRDALTKEAEGEGGRRWIEVFDFVAVDLKDRDWNHSLADLQTVVAEAEAAGYRAVLAARGVLVYCRPQADDRKSRLSLPESSAAVAQRKATLQDGLRPGGFPRPKPHGWPKVRRRRSRRRQPGCGCCG